MDRLSELSTPDEWRINGLSSGNGGEFFMVGSVIGLSCCIFLVRASRRRVFISRSCGSDSSLFSPQVRYPSIFFSRPCEQVVNIYDVPSDTVPKSRIAFPSFWSRAISGARRERRMVASSLSSSGIEEGAGDSREVSDPVMARSGLSGEIGTGADLVDSRRIESRSRASIGRGSEVLRDGGGVGMLFLGTDAGLAGRVEGI